MERSLFAVPVAAGFPSPADDSMERQLDPSEWLIQHQAATYYGLDNSMT